ncbi:hypothetical protein NDU88_001650 [Pleurodeles waltl]|uniref:Uncharacterized protein n=1 Tax=Pleurodeles waltl TaxID=8319 RepID=A0AAV7VZU7_PLEWA|nr:hypothetical protein NDU88_001650 [Pleurodeles waltl]
MMSQKNLLFDPENIIHPPSTEWVPCVEVAHYVQDKLRRSFDKDVRSTLCSECPRPSLLGKVADTMELDPSAATFLKKFTKDPKKGLNRAWKSCQDKILDLSGPITKILELTVQAKETNTPLDPEAVLECAQRAIGLLGNANCAMSTERKKSFLMRIDPKLAELAPTEPGSLVHGLLFRDKFVKDLGKYVSIFTAIDKAQSSMKPMFSGGLFTRAGCYRGRASGRSFQQTSHNYAPRGRGYYPSSSGFHPVSTPSPSSSSFFLKQRVPL